MKYKVGDEVKVREDLVPCMEYGGQSFVHYMSHYTNVTIDEVFDIGYSVKETDYYYTDEMLDGLYEREEDELLKRAFELYIIEYNGESSKEELNEIVEMFLKRAKSEMNNESNK